MGYSVTTPHSTMVLYTIIRVWTEDFAAGPSRAFMQTDKRTIDHFKHYLQDFGETLDDGTIKPKSGTMTFEKECLDKANQCGWKLVTMSAGKDGEKIFVLSDEK